MIIFAALLLLGGLHWMCSSSRVSTRSAVPTVSTAPSAASTPTVLTWNSNNNRLGEDEDDERQFMRISKLLVMQ